MTYKKYVVPTLFVLLISLLIAFIFFYKRSFYHSPSQYLVQKTSHKKPNFVFILADDLPYGLTRPDGNSLISTPFLSHMASQGVFFPKMYLSMPQCEPSRATIMTGKLPHSHGVTHNGTQLNLNQPLLPKILNQYGYKTAIFGKCHLGGDPYYEHPFRFLSTLIKQHLISQQHLSPSSIPLPPSPFNFATSGLGFTDALIMYPDNGEWLDWYDFWVIQGKTITHISPEMFIQQGDPSSLAMTKAYNTNFLTQKALDYIKSHQNQPFFVYLSFLAPHQPTYDMNLPPEVISYNTRTTYIKGKKDTNDHWPNNNLGQNYYSLGLDSLPTQHSLIKRRYYLNQLPSKPNFTDQLDNKPPQIINNKPHIKFLKAGQNFSDRLKFTQLNKLNVLEMVENIDTNVGIILNYLKQSQLNKNTIVVFMSDNGVFFGEHQMFTKGPTMYEEMTKTGFYWYAPSLYSPRKINHVVSSIDVMPTILDAAQIPIPPQVQGRSLLPLITHQTTEPPSSSVMMEYGYRIKNNKVYGYPIRALVTQDGFKFVHFLPFTIPYDFTFWTYFNKPLGTIKAAAYDGFDFELYNLNTDPYELKNLLPRYGSSNNPLKQKLNDPQLKPILIRLRRQMVEWQTQTQDPVNQVKIINPQVIVKNNHVVINWETPNYPTTSELLYKPADCPDCEFNQFNDFSFTTNHSVTLTHLSPNKTYKAIIYSIDAQGQGDRLTLEFMPQPVVLSYNLKVKINADTPNESPSCTNDTRPSWSWQITGIKEKPSDILINRSAGWGKVNPVSCKKNTYDQTCIINHLSGSFKPRNPISNWNDVGRFGIQIKFVHPHFSADYSPFVYVNLDTRPPTSPSHLSSTYLPSYNQLIFSWRPALDTGCAAVDNHYAASYFLKITAGSSVIFNDWYSPSNPSAPSYTLDCQNYTGQTINLQVTKVADRLSNTSTLIQPLSTTQICPLPTPTPTPTPTLTPTPIPTLTPTPYSSPILTLTPKPIPTSLITPTSILTFIPTSIPTFEPTPHLTPTPTPLVLIGDTNNNHTAFDRGDVICGINQYLAHQGQPVTIPSNKVSPYDINSDFVFNRQDVILTIISYLTSPRSGSQGSCQPLF